MAAFGPLGTRRASAAAASVITAAYFIAILGDVTAVLVYLSPAFVLAEIWKKRSVENHYASPYVVGFLNCNLWIQFALPLVQTHGTLVISLNCFGMVMMLVYLAIFLFHCADEERRYCIYYALYGEFAFLVCLGVVVLTLVPEKDRSLVLGVLGIITATSMYAVPVMSIMRMCAAKSVGSGTRLSLLGTVASLLNAIVWTVYASITRDPFVLVPNLVGLVVPVVELVVYYHYHKKAGGSQDDNA